MTRIQAIRTLIVVALCLVAAAAHAQFGPGGSVEFTAGNSADAIPFHLNSDKIYVQVTLNGGGPYELVLDTGSPGMILDTRVERELGIETGESFEVGGAGENPFVLAPAVGTFDAEIPGLRLLGQPAHVGNIDRIVGPFEGRRIDGVLGGHNVFSTHVVEIDYRARTIAIHPRTGYTPEPGGTEVAVEIAGGHCYIGATAVLANGDSLPGTFMLDTGLRGNLVFASPFVNEHRLLERVGRSVHATMGGGVGGEVKAHIARIEDFILAGHSLGNIYVSLSQATSGALASDDAAGIIGSAVLQRFRVVFDYAGGRLILYPAAFDRDRLDMDKSGMFLVSDADDRSVYRVIDVIPGSPADEAGLEVGDVIRGVNSAAPPTLEDMRMLLRGPAETRVNITYERDQTRRLALVTLRKII